MLLYIKLKCHLKRCCGKEILKRWMKKLWKKRAWSHSNSTCLCWSQSLPSHASRQEREAADLSRAPLLLGQPGPVNLPPSSSCHAGQPARKPWRNTGRKGENGHSWEAFRTKHSKKSQQQLIQFIASCLFRNSFQDDHHWKYSSQAKILYLEIYCMYPLLCTYSQG